MSSLTEGPTDTGDSLLGDVVVVVAPNVLGDVRLLDSTLFDAIEELFGKVIREKIVVLLTAVLVLDELIKFSVLAAVRTEIVDTKTANPNVHPHAAGGKMEILRIDTKTLDAIAKSSKHLHVPPVVRLADRVPVFPPVAEAVGEVRDDEYLEIEGGDLLGDDQVRVHLFSPIVGI